MVNCPVCNQIQPRYRGRYSAQNSLWVTKLEDFIRPVCYPVHFFIVSSCAGHSPRLEKLVERFSPKPRHHLRIGDAPHAPELFEAEEARAVADERGPVELADHLPFLGAQAGLVEGRIGIVLEKRAVRRDGQPVEEAVEPQRLGARFDVEEVGAFELFDAFELGVHRKIRFFASLVRRFGASYAPNALSSASASPQAPRTTPPPSRRSSAG